MLVTVLTAREIARRAAGVVTGDDTTTVDAWAFDSRVLAVRRLLRRAPG